MKKLTSKYVCIGSILLMMLLFANVLFASMVKTVTMSWEAPIANSDGAPLKDLAGYIVYYWAETDDYAEGIDVGNGTTYQFDLVSDEDYYYFAVTAYDTSGNESDFSNVTTFSFASLTEGVKLTSSTGGGAFMSGDPLTITWDTYATENPVDMVILKYTKDGGKTWHLIDKIYEGNPGVYDAWVIPDLASASNKCKLKVVLKDANRSWLGSDKSDSYFMMTP